MGQKEGHIRWLIRRDMHEIMEIERSCFGDQAIAEREVIEMLRQRNNIGMVIEVNEAVVGYMMYLLHTHSIELLRLAVHPQHQRRGLGRQLVEKILSKLNLKRRRVTFLVPDHLLGTHLFLKASGFRATCHGDHYYFYQGVQWKEQSLQTT